MSPKRPRSITDRLNIALSFALVGPFIGSVVVLAFLVLRVLVDAQVDFLGFMPRLMGIFLLGYMFGFGPALITGIVYAVLPGALQRLVLAPFLGAAAVWFTNGSFVDNMSNEVMILGASAGAVAALACAWIARESGWTPDHNAEPTAA